MVEEKFLLPPTKSFLLNKLKDSSTVPTDPYHTLNTDVHFSQQ